MLCSILAKNCSDIHNGSSSSCRSREKVKKQFQAQMDAFYSDSEMQRATLSDAQANYRNFKPDTS